MKQKPKRRIKLGRTSFEAIRDNTLHPTVRTYAANRKEARADAAAWDERAARGKADALAWRAKTRQRSP